MSSRYKNLTLPIEKKDFGYLQKNHYHHPDLYDEAMIELNSPFASLIASGTKIFTFLLLGDQNAGKSTFLHSFTARKDGNWYDLAREIPILSSNFINTRFIEANVIPPIDELPFLDTDIARATILLLREDFEYFLQEHNLQKEELSDDIRYIIIQFIEIGGDHLDLMMYQPKSSNKLLNTVTQSVNLLKSSLKTIYFINATTLCHPRNTIDLNQFSILLKRFNYLNQIFPHSHEILCYLTRSEEVQYNQKIFVEKIQKFYPHYYEHVDKSIHLETLPEFLYHYLKLSEKQFNWKTKCIGVFLTFHLNPDGTLNMAEIIKTLVRCFGKQMIARISDIESYILYYLIDCHKKLSMECNYNSRPVWISKDIFLNYLERLEIHELPETLILQKFPLVLQKLQNNGFGIYKLVKGNTFLNLVFKSQSGKINGNWCNNSPHDPVIPIEFRFPVYKPMIMMIEDFFNREIPVDFWLTEMKLNLTPNLIIEFKSILYNLMIEITNQWQKLQGDNVVKSKEWLELCLQIEDWVIGTMLISDSNDVSIDFKFPINLPPIDIKSINQIVQENFLFNEDTFNNSNIRTVIFIIDM